MCWAALWAEPMMTTAEKMQLDAQFNRVLKTNKKANPLAQVRFCGPLGGFGLRVSLARLLATGSDQRLVGGWAAFFSLTLLHADGSVSVHQRQSKPPDDHLLA